MAPCLAPLVFDLDGTIVRTDTLAETVLQGLLTRPWSICAALPLAWSSRAAFKQAVALASPLDASLLPYDAGVLALAHAARLDGRRVYLATAADAQVARSVACHLGLFDGVFASDGQTNLKGDAKARKLVAEFGASRFDYVGDSRSDIPVWQVARHASQAGSSGRVTRAASRAGIATRPVGEVSRGLAPVVSRALRLHQWAKNVLVFVPMLAAHAAHGAILLQACAAFVAFSLCASGVYLLNDLTDLPHDRAHATKCRRPFASGALPLAWAPGLMLALLLPVVVICAALAWQFAAMLALYYACTLSYSFLARRHAVWDVMLLAGLYTLRIFAGAAATAIPISPWLLAFSLFLFFCLAVVKRLAELTLAMHRTMPALQDAKLPGRGYLPADVDMLRSMATSSGYMSVLILALYLNSSEVLPLYHHPAVLWALCPILLFWVSRVLMLANRGAMDDDPVLFALRDPISLAACGASLVAILGATL